MQQNKYIRMTIAIIGLAVVAIAIQSLRGGSTSVAASTSNEVGGEVGEVGAEITPAQVLEIALKAAHHAGDAQPVSINAAWGSFASEQTAVEEGAGITPSQDQATPWANQSAYIVVMHGGFTLNAPVPPGHQSPKGSVMALILDAHTGFREGRYVGENAPSLATLAPIALAE